MLTSFQTYSTWIIKVAYFILLPKTKSFYLSCSLLGTASWCWFLLCHFDVIVAGGVGRSLSGKVGWWCLVEIGFLLLIINAVRWVIWEFEIFREETSFFIFCDTSSGLQGGCADNVPCCMIADSEGRVLLLTDGLSLWSTSWSINIAF